ncbi:unnamed protein product, partial [marine sediment metagenome]
KLPLVDDDGNLRGLITIKDINKILKYPGATKDELGRLRCAAAVGTTPDTPERAEALIHSGVDALVVDTSHGHSAKVIEILRTLKEKFPEIDIIVGNVGTEEGARVLAEAGADAVKVGIGPGATCTTRVVAGAGMPQITAIMEAVKGVAGMDIPVIADGGIKFSGDITKAMAAGASSVMIGNLFAGTEESPGKKVLFEGRTYKLYRGMGSVEAMKEGSKDRYFQEYRESKDKLVPEGIEGRVLYRGSVEDYIFQLLGGIRSGMGLCGASTIEELRNKTRFVRITAAGLRESHPHDIVITEEAPNYRRE